MLGSVLAQCLIYSRTSIALLVTLVKQGINTARKVVGFPTVSTQCTVIFRQHYCTHNTVNTCALIINKIYFKFFILLLLYSYLLITVYLVLSLIVGR